MEIKKLDDAGLKFLIHEEGCVLHVYKDERGIPTLGVGMTYDPFTGKRFTMDTPPITQARANAMFLAMLIPYEQAVWSTTRDDISQNSFNSLVAFAYNVGIAGFKGSTLLRRVNANKDDPKITDAFLMWKKPISLLPRRKREAALYFS
jgi:lysozyme